jgi:hypothetical protein
VRRFAWRLPVLIALIVALSACGNSSEEAAAPGEVLDLANGGALLTITFPPGDLRPGSPSAIASGDFNGDGKTDLLLGAPFSDTDGSRPDAGEAYVLYGPLSGDIDLASRAPDVRILGAVSGDNLGGGVAAGDLNGDGVDDIIVGAPLSNGIPELRTDLGEAYVVFGGSSISASIDTLSGQHDFGLLPAEGFSQLGRTFAIADVNGDGTDDLIAGAPYAGRAPNTPPGSPRTTVGEVYIVYGSADLSGQVKVAEAAEDVRLSGVNESDQFGASVTAADVNGDGVHDVIVGASGYDGAAGDRLEAGGTFVFFGGDRPQHSTLSAADVVITGAQAGDFFGTLVAASDFNGDGKAEVVASAPAGSGPDDALRSAGEVAIVDVAVASGRSIDLAVDGSRRIFGAVPNEFAPSSLVTIADGTTTRLAFGSSLHDSSSRTAAGVTYVTSGALGEDVDLATPGDRVATVAGATANDGLGAAVAFADVDDDGTPELLALAAGNASANAPDLNYSARLYAIRLR